MESRSNEVPKHNVSSGDESIDTDAFVDSYAQVPLPKHIEPKFYDCQTHNEAAMSDTPKHSPGPFELRGPDGPMSWDKAIFDADGGELLAYIPRGYDRVSLRDGDWHLFAAAPEMLQALEAIDMALAMGYPPAEVLQEGSAIRNAMKAAIAKAEGRQG